MQDATAVIQRLHQLRRGKGATQPAPVVALFRDLHGVNTAARRLQQTRLQPDRAHRHLPVVPGDELRLKLRALQVTMQRVRLLTHQSLDLRGDVLAPHETTHRLLHRATK